MVCYQFYSYLCNYYERELSFVIKSLICLMSINNPLLDFFIWLEDIYNDIAVH